MVQGKYISISLCSLILFMSWTLYKFNPTHTVFNDGLALKLTDLLPLGFKRAYIIHTAEQLCFGPYAGGIEGGAYSSEEYQLLQNVDGIWSVSRTIQKYAAEHGPLMTTFMYHHPWNYLVDGTHAFPRRRYNWDRKS